jgi:hypothetical protein
LRVYALMATQAIESPWGPDGEYVITIEEVSSGLMLDGNAVPPSGGKSQWES